MLLVAIVYMLENSFLFDYILLGQAKDYLNGLVYISRLTISGRFYSIRSRFGPELVFNLGTKTR